MLLIKATICGSMRFKEKMMNVYNSLTSHGILVWLPFMGNVTPDMINTLHFVHEEKIKNSDYAIIVDVGDNITTEGYVVKDTKREIDFAKDHNIKVIYLSDVNKKKMHITQFLRKDMLNTTEIDIKVD
jgi:hypothetical protein